MSVRTDKNSYGFGDYVEVSGTVREPVQGKAVRLDVYDPKGDILGTMNASIGRTIPLSDIRVQPNDKGLFIYRFPLDPFEKKVPIKLN